MSERLFTTGYGLLVAVGGLIVWSSAFVLFYALLSLGCRYGWDAPALAGLDLLTMLLALVWLAHIAALLWLTRLGLSRWRAIRAAGETGPALYLASLAGLVAATSLVGTVYLGAPVLILPPCA